MSFFTTGDGYSLNHLIHGYPWAAIAPGTVVDLGGSHGDAAFALARKYPDLRLIVQELPQVVANSKEEEGLNVEFMAHDFFQQQPINAADVYLFRWVLHNWSDKYCVIALKALIPALKRGARVLVMDFVMPGPGTIPNDLERRLRHVSCEIEIALLFANISLGVWILQCWKLEMPESVMSTNGRQFSDRLMKGLFSKVQDSHRALLFPSLN
jgi:hypothetical protein